MTHSKTEKGRALVFMPIFQRAVAKERLGDLDGAIQDYSKCLAIASSVSETNSVSVAALAAIHANRAGLYKVKGNLTSALEDIKIAIEMDPTNIKYRETISLLHRETGQYTDAAGDLIAAHEIMMAKNEKKGRRDNRMLAAAAANAMTSSIDWRKAAAGGKKDLRSTLTAVIKGDKDRLMAALVKAPGGSRSDNDIMFIVDFMKSTKLFASMASNETMLMKVASLVQLQSYVPGQTVFEEGELGEHFYIILEGEISIIKKKNTSALGMVEVEENVLLVKLFRGHSFGEAALENAGGLRTAGAVATKASRLLCMGANEYQAVLAQAKKKQKEKVSVLLLSSPLFATWESSKIDTLAGCAMVRNYNPNTEVLAVGESSKYLMMIVTGVVTLLKSVALPSSKPVKKPSTIGTSSGINSRNNSPAKVSAIAKISSHTVNSASDDEEEQDISVLASVDEDDGSNSDGSSNDEEDEWGRFSGIAQADGGLRRPKNTDRNRVSFTQSTGLAAAESMMRPRSGLPSSAKHLPRAGPGAIRPQTAAARHTRDNKNKSPPSPPSRKELDESIRNIHRQRRVKERQLEEVPGLWVLEKTWGDRVSGVEKEPSLQTVEEAEVRKTDLVVAVLGSGQVFGEWTIINPKATSTVAAVAYTALEVYCFDINILIALGIRFNVDTMLSLQENFRLLDAPAEKLIYYFNKKYNWELKKKILMKSLKLNLKDSHKE
eukprot:CAMPEP_0170069532 /NCGR_PEP_ID=MMETSP0019_2-20121128/8171_1 /TAXON_ID=98059 /ORGANISM="Dinobryon sp., Strain UTEXLB2267" /LENGTH=717 /DNA_ID=CAMNT_0010277599 /DNA_START=431 /DNA_END=2584 /DNA_ORIENTATION=+